MFETQQKCLEYEISISFFEVMSDFPPLCDGMERGSHKARKSVHVHQIPKNELDLKSHYSLHQIDREVAIPSRSITRRMPSPSIPPRLAAAFRTSRSRIPGGGRGSSAFYLLLERTKVDFAKISCTDTVSGEEQEKT